MSKSFRLPLDYKEKVGRGVHDFSCQKRFTMHPMLLYPAYGRTMKRGEKFVFSTPQLLLQSLPTHSPLMGNYRLRIEWYFNSFANLYGWIDNNTRLTPEEVKNRRHHTCMPRNINSPQAFAVDQHQVGMFSDEEQVLRTFGSGIGGVADFMGVPPGFLPPVVDAGDEQFDYSDGFGSRLNIDFALSYLNIVRCYHVNQQFPNIPYVLTLTGQAVHDTGTVDSFRTIDIRNLDNIFMLLRYFENGYNFDLSHTYTFPYDEIPERYHDAYVALRTWLSHCFEPNGGLFCCQYQPDLYRNLLPQDQNLLESKVAVNPDGTLSITAFRFGSHLQKVYDRINPFGGKDSVLSRTRWGVTSNNDYDIPELICVQTETIDTTNITSNNAGVGSFDGQTVTSAPGEMAGKVDQRKFIGGKQSFTANTPGVLMAIVSLVPMVDYCENIERDLLLNNFEDEFSPQMAGLGFEDVPMSDYCALPTASMDPDFIYLHPTELDEVVGRQVYWLRDMTAVNRVHGEFVRLGKFKSWVLSRNYLFKEYSSDAESSSTDIRVSPYGNPLDWQYPFLTQDLSNPNWFCQIAFDIKSISPVGYRFMPTLE